MSDISIPGLEIAKRSGSFRARVRVHPFFTLSQTCATELAAAIWGCSQIQRLQSLYAQLQREGRLPSNQLTQKSALQAGLLHLILPPVEGPLASSPGDEVFVHEVLDTYMEHEAARLSAGYPSRAKRLKEYFGNVAISSITTASLDAYVDARKSGLLGSGRSDGAAYASKNRRDQENRRRRKKGIPVVEACQARISSRCLHTISSRSRHQASGCQFIWPSGQCTTGSAAAGCTG